MGLLGVSGASRRVSLERSLFRETSGNEVASRSEHKSHNLTLAHRPTKSSSGATCRAPSTDSYQITPGAHLVQGSPLSPLPAMATASMSLMRAATSSRALARSWVRGSSTVPSRWGGPGTSRDAVSPQRPAPGRHNRPRAPLCRRRGHRGRRRVDFDVRRRRLRGGREGGRRRRPVAARSLGSGA